MPTVGLIPTLPILAFQDSVGAPAAAYLLHTYQAGTLIAADTWQDQARTTVNTNPIVLDARGECRIWLAQGQEYRLVLTTPGGTQVWDVDDVSGAQSSAVTIPSALGDLDGHSGPLMVSSGVVAWLDGPMAGRNAVINGEFRVNQRVVGSPVTLAAGAFGHDHWQGGSAGCTYNFASVSGLTTLSISAGTLAQIIEAAYVPPGLNTCVLSWTGSAQGRIASGSFAASGLTAAVTGGADLRIEFSAGTLSDVHLEIGSVPTAIERRPYTVELLLCQRYYQRIGYDGGIGASGYSPTICGSAVLPVRMRASPSVAVKTPFTKTNANEPSAASASVSALTWTASAVGVGAMSVFSSDSGYFELSAEL